MEDKLNKWFEAARQADPVMTTQEIAQVVKRGRVPGSRMFRIYLVVVIAILAGGAIAWSTWEKKVAAPHQLLVATASERPHLHTDEKQIAAKVQPEPAAVVKRSEKRQSWKRDKCENDAFF